MTDSRPTDTPDDVGGAQPLAIPRGIATPEFIASLLVDGDDDLVAWAITQALEEQPRSAVFDDVLRGAMELVGSNWRSGHWLISQEHLATVALTAALARVRPGDPGEARIGPVAVLAAPEGEDHVTGLACLAQILEEHGWRAENLGANVPALDLQQFIAGRAVDLVALSIATRERLPALRNTIDALRAGSDTGTHVPILVGGHGIAGHETSLEGADHVSPTLADAEQYIAGLRQRMENSAEG